MLLEDVIKSLAVRARTVIVQWFTVGCVHDAIRKKKNGDLAALAVLSTKIFFPIPFPIYK